MQYNAIKEVIKNMFANEKFIDSILSLVNIKANSEHTVKDVINALNNLENAKIFGENQDINKYKFQYNTALDLDAKLITNKKLAIDVYVFDENTNQPFFNTQFDFKVLGENDLEQYERITEKITKHLNNKEVDLSSYNELNADGKVVWNQTLSNIVKPDKIYDYFNFKILGDDVKTDYANVVDFDLSLDNEKKDDMDNNYFTYNSKEKYVAVKLKLSKKGSTDSSYKLKNVELKIKVGGFTEQQIYQKQEEAAEKLKQLILQEQKTQSYEEDSFKYSSKQEHFENFTFKNVIDYFLDKTFVDDKEILEYLDINYSITANKTMVETLSENDHIFNYIKKDVKRVDIEMQILPKGKTKWKNNIERNVDILRDIVKDCREYIRDRFASFMKENNLENINHIILNKKDVINGKQIAVRNFANKMHENLKNFIDKAPSWIKNIYENLPFTLTFCERQPNGRWYETSEEEADVWTLEYPHTYHYSIGGNNGIGFNITFEIKD